MFSDTLINLPAHILVHITGERRKRLVEYLLRWGEPVAALSALDGWLAAQPHLVTLREARARVLLELGRAEDTVAVLDEIDAERGLSESRRALRARALAALGRWEDAHALLADRPGDIATLRALDVWLAAQPHLVTLREARARVLLEDGRAKQALAVLDTIDAEREMSESRRALRLRCLAALGRWDAAHALLPDRPDDPAAWRLRADLLCRQTRFAEAAQAYRRAAELMPEGSAPIRGLAELALAQGGAAHARALLRDRHDRTPDAPVATADLLLLREAAEPRAPR